MERKDEKGSEEDDYFNKCPPTMPSVVLENTCEYGIIVLPLSVDQSKKMEANAFIKMAQFYNNLIMKRSKK